MIAMSSPCHARLRGCLQTQSHGHARSNDALSRTTGIVNRCSARQTEVFHLSRDDAALSKRLCVAAQSKAERDKAACVSCCSISHLAVFSVLGIHPRFFYSSTLAHRLRYSGHQSVSSAFFFFFLNFAPADIQSLFSLIEYYSTCCLYLPL